MVDRVFISYTRRDSGTAERLVDALRSVGLSVWLGRESLAAGTLIIEEVSKAVQSADAVLVLVTEDSLASAWVQREIEFAAFCETGGQSAGRAERVRADVARRRGGT